MAKLQRRKIEVKPEGSITHLARNIEWKIPAESGEPIDAACISHIHDSEQIFEQLLIWSRNQASKRATVNTVLRYLKYVASLNGAVSCQSLIDFKHQLNVKNSASANTKAQIFSTCRNFVKFLMTAEVIATNNLPKNFSYTKKNVKPSICELVKGAVKIFANENKNVIERIKKKYEVKREEAEALAYGDYFLERYHTLSLDWIKSWFEDCMLIDNILKEITDKDMENMREVKDYRLSVGDWSCISSERTLKLAFQILYSKFGRLIPSSIDWPQGIDDFCKSRGWPPRRIQSAFFTSTYNLQYFLVAALSHKELAPNVDTVVFYTYTDAFMPSTESGKIAVHMGKKRGSPIDKELSRKDPLCVAFYAYQNRLKKLLKEVRGGQAWLLKENCELFLHFTKSKGKYSIRCFDKSMTSYMVRSVTKQLAKQHPEFKALVNEVTGENFKPTIAAVEVLSGSSLSQLKYKLNHKHLSTTEGYGIRVETQTLHDRKLSNFQEYLLSQRSKEFPDTGNGYQCGREEVPEVTCGGIEMCFDCPAKRVVLKDPKLIAEWLAYSRWIEANEQRLKFNNKQRWEDYWQLKLAEYSALLAKCSRAEVLAAESVVANIKIAFMD